jgi:rSAM/selenodomain-associated transferase 1
VIASPPPTHCLGVFAKYWKPGQVKTRLAASLGAETAARLYETFVAATVARLSAVECRRVLAYTPADDQTLTAFQAAGLSDWSLEPQAEGDLGARITAYFDQQFRSGAQRVVLLGSDSPNVPLIEVQAAFEHLKTDDVVLGPTEDGGYYLVGAAHQTPPIFHDIPWSTPEVLAATTARLAGLRHTLLDAWYDVDELFDLHRLLEDLRDQSEKEPALAVLLEHVQKVLEA